MAAAEFGPQRRSPVWSVRLRQNLRLPGPPPQTIFCIAESNEETAGMEEETWASTPGANGAAAWSHGDDDAMVDEALQSSDPAPSPPLRW
jgi:hypothetical protein